MRGLMMEIGKRGVVVVGGVEDEEEEQEKRMTQNETLGGE